MTSYRDIGQGFEFEFDIGGLYEYETPMKTQVEGLKVDFVSLDRFSPRSDRIPGNLDNTLKRIAHLLVASFSIGMDVREVDIGGYVDTTGGDALSGKDLGRMRAEAVRAVIAKKMDDIVRGSSSKVRFNLSSGPTAPIQTSNHALNRRVVVRLPRTCQVFFAEYDLQSFGHAVIGVWANPAITNKEERLNNVLFVGQELDARLKKRAEQALAGNIMPALREKLTRPTFETIKKGAEDLSAMQLTLFGKYHPKFPVFDPASLMSCFLKFANGEMRSPHRDFETGDNKGRKSFGVGEPDSNHVFYFAEFAFLCLDWNIGPTPMYWANALPAMVAAQEVFMHVYRENPRSPPPAVDADLPRLPATVTHPLDKFGAKNFRSIGGSQTKGEGQSDATRLAALTAKYDKMIGVEQMRFAMSRNLLRAQTLR